MTFVCCSSKKFARAASLQVTDLAGVVHCFKRIALLLLSALGCKLWDVVTRGRTNQLAPEQQQQQHYLVTLAKPCLTIFESIMTAHDEFDIGEFHLPPLDTLEVDKKG